MRRRWDAKFLFLSIQENSKGDEKRCIDKDYHDGDDEIIDDKCNDNRNYYQEKIE